MTVEILAVGLTIILAIAGAAWILGLRIGKVETTVAGIARLEEKVDGIATAVGELRGAVFGRRGRGSQ